MAIGINYANLPRHIQPGISILFGREFRVTMCRECESKIDETASNWGSWFDAHKDCSVAKKAREPVTSVPPHIRPTSTGYECACGATLLGHAKQPWVDMHKRCGEQQKHCTHTRTYASGYCMDCGKYTRTTEKTAAKARAFSTCATCSRNIYEGDAAFHGPPPKHETFCSERCIPIAKPKVGPWEQYVPGFWKRSEIGILGAPIQAQTDTDGIFAFAWVRGKGACGHQHKTMDEAKSCADAFAADRYDVPDPVTVPTQMETYYESPGFADMLASLPRDEFVTEHVTGEQLKERFAARDRHHRSTVRAAIATVPAVNPAKPGHVCMSVKGKPMCMQWSSMNVALTPYTSAVTCPNCLRCMDDIDERGQSASANAKPAAPYGIQLPVDDPNGLDVCEEL